MELASVAANAMIKLFIMVLIGFAAAKLNFIEEKGTVAIANLVNKVTNPLKIFTSYLMVYDAVKFKGLMTSAGLMTIAMFISIAAASIFIREKGDYWRVERAAVVLSNCGFMGIPLISAVLGNEAIFYLTGCIMVFNIMAWTYGITVVSGRTSFKDMLRIITSPTVLAIIAGLVVYLLQIPIPEMLSDPLFVVGDCTSPLAMVCAGATIARTRLGKTIKRGSSWVVIALRLLICPLIFSGVCLFFDIPDLVFMTVFIASACPIATVVVTQAVMENRTPGHASGLFGIAALLSIGTIPLVIIIQNWIQSIFN